MHHDLWDYDLAAQPALTTIEVSGQAVPAVLLATKMGHFFAFDRRDGQPIWPIAERRVPASPVAGEQASPTQPFPAPDLALHPDSYTLWEHSAEHLAYCEKLFAGRHFEGPFTPPSLEGTVLYPGNAGGTNWGSVAVHREKAIAVMAVNRLPTIVTLIPRDDFEERRGKESGGPQGVQFTEQSGAPYGMSRFDAYNPGLTLPCLRGPWGTWVAVDLKRGVPLWETPAGPFPAAVDHPEASQWGSLLSGGAMTTAGNLVIGASPWDRTLMVMDVDTGKVLRRLVTPAAVQATPMSYRHEGKQYIVVTAGGSQPDGEFPGDYVLAYALP